MRCDHDVAKKASRSKRSLDRAHHVFNRKSEILEQLTGGGGFAVTIDPHHRPTQPDVLAPQVGYPGLDGNPRDASNTDVDGMLTTRTGIPSLASAACAATASCSSEPVPMSTARADGASEST